MIRKEALDIFRLLNDWDSSQKSISLALESDHIKENDIFDEKRTLLLKVLRVLSR